MVVILATKRSAGVALEVNLREYTSCIPPPSANKAAHSGFEIQRRCHQKSKTGTSVAPRNGLYVSSKIKKKTKSYISSFFAKQISYPPEAVNKFTATIGPLTVEKRELSARLVELPETITAKSPFSVMVEIIDSVTKDVVQNLGWKVSNVGIKV